MSQSGRSRTASSAVRVVEEGAVLQIVCLGREAASDA